MDGWRRPGFSIPGYAAAAARKNHELGTAHQFTSLNARENGLKGGRPRGPDRRVERRDVNPGRRVEDRP